MAHIHEKIDFTVSVYIVHDEAVLLRMHEKYGRWFPAGGHIELDEDPNHAAVREAKEETGLDVVLRGTVPEETEGGEYRNLIPPRFMNIHYVRKDEDHRHVDLIYIATADTRELDPATGEEATDMRWFSAEEFENPIHGVSEVVRHYALVALAEKA